MNIGTLKDLVNTLDDNMSELLQAMEHASFYNQVDEDVVGYHGNVVMLLASIKQEIRDLENSEKT